MTEEQAKEVIYNAMSIAMTKGCFNLDETAIIVDASRLILAKEKTEL
jgi:hypothetical protein